MLIINYLWKDCKSLILDLFYFNILLKISSVNKFYKSHRNRFSRR